MARALEATPLTFDTVLDDKEQRVTRKAETAHGIQDAVALIQVAADVPREIRPSTVDGFKSRKDSALTRGRVERENNRELRREELVR